MSNSKDSHLIELDEQLLAEVAGGLAWEQYACEPSKNVERRDIQTMGDFARFDRALDAWNSWCGGGGGGYRFMLR